MTKSDLRVCKGFEVIEFQKWLIPLHSLALLCLACAAVESGVSVNEKDLVRQLREW